MEVEDIDESMMVKTVFIQYEGDEELDPYRIPITAGRIVIDLYQRSTV